MRLLTSLLTALAWPILASTQENMLPGRSTPAVDRLLHALEESYQAKDVARFVSLFADDFHQVDVNRRIDIRGIEAWRRQTENVNAAHREMARVHRGRVVQGNVILAEIEWSGVVRGAEFGTDSADRPYRFSGLGMMEVADGKIRRQVLYIDYATYGQQLASPQQPALPRAPGRMIDVGGRRMHINCTGRGKPIVVVDQGAGGWSAHWMHLHQRLARNTRICLYDRAGIGWSDPSQAPATAERAALDLARLLETAGEVGPFLLVGHSYGGYVNRVFHARRPQIVAGIVLVESGHEDQWTRLPPPLTQITRAAVPQLRAYAAALRRGDKVPTQPVDSAFKDPEQRRVLEAFARHPGQYEELANVIDAIDSSTAQVRRAGSLGRLPLVVITARKSFNAFRHLPIDVAASDSVWRLLQGELRRLSTCSRGVWSAKGDHNINVTDPDVVVEVIDAMGRALRAGSNGACPLESFGR